MNDFCAYCKGEHAHLDCVNVKSVEEYHRCFIGARKGHISHDCNSKINCKGKHHVSICYEILNGTTREEIEDANRSGREPGNAANSKYTLKASDSKATEDYRRKIWRILLRLVKILGPVYRNNPILSLLRAKSPYCKINMTKNPRLSRPTIRKSWTCHTYQVLIQIQRK